MKLKNIRNMLPEGIFPRVTSQLTISQVATSHRFNLAFLGASGCKGDRALWLKQARRSSAEVRTDLGSCRFGNSTFGKLPLGKIPFGKLPYIFKR